MNVISVEDCQDDWSFITEQHTGSARLIRSHSSARFSFELSGNSNYIIHCNSNYVLNFKLEINSIWDFKLGFTLNSYFELWLPSN